MLLNFQARFAPKIKAKLKRHTIRAKRARRPRVGEICHCYIGLRRKGAKLLGRWPCIKVQDILIYECGDGTLSIWIDGVELAFSERDLFARSDGFVDFADMSAFWTQTWKRINVPLVFRGDMIHWDPQLPVTSTRRRAGGIKQKAGAK